MGYVIGEIGIHAGFYCTKGRSFTLTKNSDVKTNIKTKQTSELTGDTNQNLHLSRLLLKTVCVKLYYTKENTLNKIFNLNL